MRTLVNQAAQVTGYAREMRAGVGYELKNHATGNTADLAGDGVRSAHENRPSTAALYRSYET